MLQCDKSVENHKVNVKGNHSHGVSDSAVAQDLRYFISVTCFFLTKWKNERFRSERYEIYIFPDGCGDINHEVITNATIKLIINVTCT